MSAATERILCIDPALRNTGWAVLEVAGKSTALIECGIVRNAPKLLPSGCLVAIRENLSDVIGRYGPSVCAIESTIYVQSFKTAIALGTARGAALIAAAERGLAIYEYAPREVKNAAVGRGSADKQQVAFMIRSMLRLRETPPADVADAIAVGLAHVQAMEANRALQSERRRI
ncbi:MAG: crossover junction endodeoxyribonuclease RuvC [Verrucomicrobiaceae bacterium]|nr:crossover junction endodeoxyribonuclease RuvC [Verrucomicrobiaceae bacterium]